MKAYIVTCDVDESTVLVEAENEAEAVETVATLTIELFGIPELMVRAMQDLVFHAREATEQEAAEHLPVNGATSDEEYLSREISNGVLAEVGLGGLVGSA